MTEPALYNVDMIEYIRERNNKNWMDVLRLAIEYAPRDKVKETLEHIMERDKEVHEACQRLLDRL